MTYIQFTITPSVKYSSGGYVEIVVNSTFMSFTSPFLCAGFAGTVGSTTCTLANTTAGIMQKDLSSGLLVTLSSMVFQMEFFKNPLGVMTTPPMEIYFYSSSGAIVAQNTSVVTYTTTESTCTVSSAVRGTSVLTVGLTGATYTLVFTCATRIPSVGKLTFTFPAE